MDIRRLNKRLLSLEEEDQSFGSPKPFTKKREDEPYTPTNSELSFLDKATFKKCEDVEAIAKEFGLTQEDVERLANNRLLSINDGILYSRYKETEDLVLARAWANLKQEDKGLIKSPAHKFIDQVEGKTTPINHVMNDMDFDIAYKLSKTLPLTKKEEQRTVELLRNGIICTSPTHLEMLQGHKEWQNNFDKNEIILKYFGFDSTNTKCEVDYIPTNAELSFIEDLKYKNVKEIEETCKKHGRSDEDVQNLAKQGLISQNNGMIFSSYIEKNEVTQARFWTNINKEEQSAWERPLDKYLLLTDKKTTPIPFKITKIDYDIAYKAIKDIPLSKKENKRAVELFRNGIIHNQNEYIEILKAQKEWKKNFDRNEFIAKHFGFDNVVRPILGDYIPTNAELLFMEKISFKEGKKVKDTAKSCGLKEEEIEHLRINNFITERKGVSYSQYKEDPEITMGRVWLNLPEDEKNLIERPTDETLKKLEGKTTPVNCEIQNIDFDITYKSERGLPLTKKEEQRTNELLRNGILHTSPKRITPIQEHGEWQNHYIKNETILKYFGSNIQECEAEYIPTNIELSFIDDLKFKKVKHIEETCKKHGLSEEDVQRLAKHGLISQNDGTIYSSYTEKSEITEARFWSNLNEEEKSSHKKPLDEYLQIVDKKTTPIPFQIKDIDYNLVYKTIKGIDLNKKEKTRVAELFRNGIVYNDPKHIELIKSQDKWQESFDKNEFIAKHFGFNKFVKKTLGDYIPTNAELSFMEKTSFKAVKNIEAMAKDYGLQEQEIKNLINNNFITERNGISYSQYKEDPAINLGRTWLNLPEDEKRLIEKPTDETLKKLEGKTRPIDLKIQSVDYFLAYKSLRDAPFEKTEEKRANEIRRNGRLPTSLSNLKELKPKPKSWVLAKAKNKALAQHFTQIHNIDIEAIKFINLFKQVTPEQLAQIVKDPSNISIYTNHLDPEKKFTTSSKLLKKETMISPEGAITYLSINHTGDFSGRRLLEQHIPKKEINAHPQKRSDLRYHDIKVVDSLLHVTDELKKEGYSIKEIHNESAQYAINKTGKQNNERQNGPSYMDVVIEVEKTDPETGETRTEKIAVEYGNYSLNRMKSKIESSHFDKAYIYSKSNYCATYQKNINTNKNVTFRSL